MRLIDADELIVMEFGGIKFVPKEFIDEAPTIEERKWIPCSERLPEQQHINGVPLYQEFFVTVAERWPGEDWKYNTDIGNIPGDYIDCFWGTINDWDEGQEVHVIAWMPLPTPYDGGEQDGNDTDTD